MPQSEFWEVVVYLPVVDVSLKDTPAVIDCVTTPHVSTEAVVVYLPPIVLAALT